MYGKPHQYFLQYMLRNSYVSLNDALNYCRSCEIECVENADKLEAFICEINKKIVAQKLKISVVHCEVTGDIKIALLNLANDAISKAQIGFAQEEIHYFQFLLEELITTDNHKIRKMICFNLKNMDTYTLQKDKIEVLLDKLINTGYLAEKDAFVYLGARCIAEFAPYFHNNCKEYFTLCYLCSESLFSGMTCSSCKKVMHKHCMYNYLGKHDDCPRCKCTWDELNVEVNCNNRTVECSTDDDEDLSQTVKSRKRRRL